MADSFNALLGGVLIGISVSLMLYWNGRVTGISGIVNGLLTPLQGDTLWRALFVIGLLLGGLVLKVLQPTTLENTLNSPTWSLVTAGLLVGFGTVMGSGCTSGHGVCGVSRLSPRSILATLSFIFAGVAVVFVLRKLGVYL